MNVKKNHLKSGRFTNHCYNFKIIFISANVITTNFTALSHKFTIRAVFRTFY